MTFSVPEPKQAHAAERGAAAPRADAPGSPAPALTARPAGRLRPSQVPVPGKASSPHGGLPAHGGASTYGSAPAQSGMPPRRGPAVQPGQPSLTAQSGLTVQRVRQLRPSGGRAEGPLRSRPSASPAAAAAAAAPVRGVLRSPGRPLSAPLRQEMEGRLGADFSDVRVHTDAAADQAAEAVSAHAFTAGSHIAFRRGRYAPASAEGRHTLAHELTHVLQQRSGPVAGTGEGIRVSDPADRFERAAQASAQRALTGPQRTAAPAPPGAGLAGHPATPTGDAVPVQRAVGYEYELLPNASVVKYATGARKKQKKTDSKGPVAFLDSNGDVANVTAASPYRGKAYISSDNGNVEYVTGPLDTEAEIRAAVGGIVKFHKDSKARSANKPLRVTGPDGEEYTISIQGVPDARPQATIGIALQHVLNLFATLGRWKRDAAGAPAQEPEETYGPGKRTVKKTLRQQESEEQGAARKRRKTDDKEEVDEAAAAIQEAQRSASRDQRARDEAKARVVSITADHVAEADLSARATLGALRKRGTVFDAAEIPKVLGFLGIIFKTTFDAAGIQVDPAADAKYYFSLMPRTDFISMIRSMNTETREALEKGLIQAIADVQGEEWLSGNVLGGYKGTQENPDTKNKQWKGPVRREWLKSVLSGAEFDWHQDKGRVTAKDLLSPPPGYPAHADTAHPEGMGAMATDPSHPELSLFELRGLWTQPGGGGAGPLAVDSWLPLALVVFQLVQEATTRPGPAPASPVTPENESPMTL